MEKPYIKTCPICGDYFRTQKSNQKYCSIICSEANKKHKIVVSCKICGKKKTHSIYRGKYFTQFCGKYCMKTFTALRKEGLLGKYLELKNSILQKKREKELG